MRLSNQQISELNNILQEILGVAPSNVDSQAIGLAIVRFVSVKELQKHQSTSKEKLNEKTE